MHEYKNKFILRLYSKTGNEIMIVFDGNIPQELYHDPLAIERDHGTRYYYQVEVSNKEIEKRIEQLREISHLKEVKYLNE